MSKAKQSGKAESGKKRAKTKKENKKKLWTVRDSILLDYLVAVADAKAEESNDQAVFSDNLRKQLLTNADLRTKVAAHANMAKRVVGCLTCGQKVVREFIQEVLRNQPVPGKGGKCLTQKAL